ARFHQCLPHRLGWHPRRAIGCPPSAVQVRRPLEAGTGLREPRMSACDKPGLLPVEQALERLLTMADAAPITETERLPLANAEGRVLAEALVAGLDLPPWPNSPMDGYALRRDDWN